MGPLAVVLADELARAAGEILLYAPFALGFGLVAGFLVRSMWGLPLVLVLGVIAWWVVIPDGPECDPARHHECDSQVVVGLAALLVLGCWVTGTTVGAVAGWFTRR